MVTCEQFLEIVRRSGGRTLETVTGKRFRVGTYLDCPFYTPESSGRDQGSYARVTRNASYHIGLSAAAGVGRTAVPDA